MRIKTRSCRPVLWSAAVLAGIAQMGSAETLLVPSEYDTIQAAIEAAVAGDVVEIADGTYAGEGNKDLDFLGKAITVRSASGDPAVCIIDCEHAGRGFQFRNGEGPDSVVAGLTITRGLPTVSYGGAVYCSGSSPTFENCTISDCTVSGAGAGIYCAASAPTFLDCTISDNTALGSGGALSCSANSGATLVRCTIRDNHALSSGGAILSGNDTLTLVECTFESNNAGYRGGALFNMSGDPAITDCVFSGNSAGDSGGACAFAYSSPVLTDCTFVNNWGNGWGGGAVWCIEDSHLTMSGCTVSGNSIDGGGGGVYCHADATILDCIVVNNTANQIGGAGLHFAGSNVTVSNCFISGNVAAGSGRCGGAGVHISYYSSALMMNCTVVNNTTETLGGGDGGGGVKCGDSSLTMVNCTVGGNNAPAQGGGVFASEGSIIATNTILWGNSPDQAGASSGTLDFTYCALQGGWAGAGNIDADPLFVDPDGPDDDQDTWQDNDYRLLAGSPGIDAADNTAVPADVFDLDGDGDTAEPVPIDLDGNPRFVDDPDTVDTGNGAPPLVDMGAYEFQGAPGCPGDLDGDGDTDQSDLGILMAAYGNDAGGDLDGDGDTDQSDLGIILADWGCRP